MTDFNAMWLLVGLLIGVTAGITGLAFMFAVGSWFRHRDEPRARSRACLRAWRELLPGWRPDRDQLNALDAESPQLVAAYRAIAEGWPADCARWDVLIAVLVYTRREALRLKVSELRTLAEQAPPVELVRHPADLAEQHPAELLVEQPAPDVITT